MKIGDKVIITKFNGQEIRHEAEIIELTFNEDTSPSFFFSPSIEGYKGGRYFSSSYGDTFETVEKPKFKVGDRVKITDPKGGHNYYGNYKYGVIKGKYPDGEWTIGDFEYDGPMNCSASEEIEFPERCLELVEKKEDIQTLVPIYAWDTGYEEIFEKVYKGRWLGLGVSEYLEKSNKLNKKTMETTKSIVEFAKNLTLSKEEKLLRKVGLKDSDGDWTEEARHIVKDKRAKESGYKNFDAMQTSVGSSGVSVIEYAHLFDKYKEELIKIATEFEKENKKK